jgi:hypothetical protein
MKSRARARAVSRSLAHAALDALDKAKESAQLMVGITKSPRHYEERRWRARALREEAAARWERILKRSLTVVLDEDEFKEKP